MTLILGLDCAEGLILASDSQMTFETGQQPVKGPTQKIHAAWSNVAWGASGFVGMIQRVDQHLRHRFPKSSEFEQVHSNDIRKKLSTAVAEVVRPLYEKQYISIPGQTPPLCSFLFVGCNGGKPFLVEVHSNLAETDHIENGYVAIGSGDIFPYFALVGLAHFDIRNRSLREARAIAHRVMNDAINVAATGLGPPIQMIEITKPQVGPGEARVLSRDEIESVAEGVAIWKQLESETLTKYLGINPQPEDQPVQ